MVATSGGLALPNGWVIWYKSNTFLGFSVLVRRRMRWENIQSGKSLLHKLEDLHASEKPGVVAWYL